MRIVFLGPPGAGKGTQAETISKIENIPHISSGNLLREAIEAGTETGAKARFYIEKGILVPDQVVVGIVVDRILKHDCENGFVLDGFPRTLSQAKVLDEMLKTLGDSLDIVFYFIVSEQTVIDRLSGRMICSVCGANYHIKLVPPLKNGICDKCGGKLLQRADDKPETIIERLKVYREQTADLVEYYKKNKILREIISDLRIEVISKTIADIINQECKKQKKTMAG
ncbi:adenylate kinase [Candidatus Kuenenia stuttgartiensis]|jgi:adenylate kinase|uniref:Adenylate kinase n=1 Tax=Kuenenia stuttgartiensis TaxID=174633 RepID=Q1Q156_KUEST|nr:MULTISPECIES: adenylate kinase [Kuenenia]MBE7547842.1 adenylate kinase [Planctomycetia bacterium]MBW7941624.1 adenylate kinase [Candidatus Kuenenia stuttgartiensis]MBZ0191197.1 adenylate kinase [Candidatus Kuenenia stuttgartiensis]MCF6152385.1 adenylate kinase [Candidatus Kuenenia stuttgartiensis]MCL4726118.1 adenylate kinase [Candidatus Kuenenia stuttgartiensis]